MKQLKIDWISLKNKYIYGEIESVRKFLSKNGIAPNGNSGRHTKRWRAERNSYQADLEKIYNFTTHARYWFAKGDTDTKRTILSALGSNLKL
ncbi:hypothetical protein IPM62_05500 [Candidatus Woesebacteria bacterium]|nr:MAG: hypothetical protein IPM62_05500 [Candidatus Woesebacteria bacterium]